MRDDRNHTIIAEAHQADIEQARALLKSAIDQANESWISMPAVGDALLLEFIELAGRNASPAQLANHLSNIANELLQAQDRAH